MSTRSMPIPTMLTRTAAGSTRTRRAAGASPAPARNPPSTRPSHEAAATTREETSHSGQRGRVQSRTLSISTVQRAPSRSEASSRAIQADSSWRAAVARPSLQRLKDASLPRADDPAAPARSSSRTSDSSNGIAPAPSRAFIAARSASLTWSLARRRPGKRDSAAAEAKPLLMASAVREEASVSALSQSWRQFRACSDPTMAA